MKPRSHLVISALSRDVKKRLGRTWPRSFQHGRVTQLVYIRREVFRFVFLIPPPRVGGERERGGNSQGTPRLSIISNLVTFLGFQCNHLPGARGVLGPWVSGARGVWLTRSNLSNQCFAKITKCEEQNCFCYKSFSCHLVGCLHEGGRDGTLNGVSPCMFFFSYFPHSVKILSIYTFCPSLTENNRCSSFDWYWSGP